MASYNIWWKASTKEVKVIRAGEITPVGYTNIKTIVHNGEADPIGEYPDSHIIYHHVRDALYEEGVTNMQSVTIVAFDEIINVSAISVAPATVELDMNNGESQQLTVTFTPIAPSNTALTYESSDELVATVDIDGLVESIGVGEATITVTSVDGGFTDTCVVTVITSAT